MSDQKIAAVNLAAGTGKRMKSQTAQVLHEIGGRAMIGHVIDAVKALNPVETVVVIGDHAPEAGDYARDIDPKISVALQSPANGTAHAVEQAMPALETFNGAVLVLYADTPLVSPQTMSDLADTIAAGAAVAVLGFRPDDPGAYGLSLIHI